jgi:hypothetical protein
MSKLQGEILTLPKMSGNVGAKTINTGGIGGDGATFIPHVSVDGIISWTNDKDLPNPEPVNIKGKDGYTPVKGKDYFTEADKGEIAQQAAELVDSVEAVLYTSQTLTDKQKAQARDNIGSISVEEFNALKSDIETALDNIISIQNKLIGGDVV